jgi:hypothetical protein
MWAIISLQHIHTHGLSFTDGVKRRLSFKKEGRIFLAVSPSSLTLPELLLSQAVSRRGIPME